MKLKIHFSHKEELWNSWSHAGGILLGVVFGIIFLYWCFTEHNGWATAGVILYLFGMLMSYIASTTYHAISAWSKWKERLRKWDHAAIYWHIAGSYSPITLIALRDQGYWGWSLFIFIWACAIAGTVMSFAKLKDHSNLETLCFVGLFKLFYEQPKKLHPFIQYMLTHEPSQKTRDNLLKGIERQQPVACIAETLDLLLKLRIEFDNRPIRTKLLALLQDPVSFGHYGLMARLRSVALLHKYLKDDETRDKSTIAALQAFYKVCKNADIRHRIKEMMKDLDEEIFDFEDEDDDFEDLNDEDEGFH